MCTKFSWRGLDGGQHHAINNKMTAGMPIITALWSTGLSWLLDSLHKQSLQCEEFWKFTHLTSLPLMTFIECICFLLLLLTDDHLASPEQHTFIIISVLRHQQGWFLLEAPQKQICFVLFCFFQLLRVCPHFLACGHSSLLLLSHHFSDFAQYC